MDNLTVTDIICEGDAQIMMMRGKKKVICDLTSTITWNFFPDGRIDDPVELKITVLEITADRELEFNVFYPPKVATEVSNSLRPIIELLKQNLNTSIDTFIDQLTEK